MVDLDWVRDYQDSINSPQSCINEWNEMPDILVSINYQISQYQKFYFELLESAASFAGRALCVV